MKLPALRVITRLTKLAAFLVVLLLIGYIGYLIQGQYRAQMALQLAEQHNLVHDSERRAMAVSYFYAERADNLRDFAQSSEVRGYFENRALGMSLEYGLQASIYIINDYFKRICDSKMLGETLIYERLLLLDMEGRVLADSRQWKGGEEQSDWRKYVTASKNMEIYRIGSSDKPRIILASPCYFKRQRVGQLVAELNSLNIYEYFLGDSGSESRFPIALLFGSEILHLPATAKGLLPGDSGRFPAEWQPGSTYRYHTVARGEVEAVLTRVNETPFAFATFVPAASLRDDSYPRKLLVTMAAIALSILLGMAFLIRYATRNTILQAHLEETRLREQAIEEKNRLLEAEFAERRRVEEEIRCLNAELEERVKSRTADLEASNRELEAFCYSVSHDLRAPLTRLEGFSMVLQEEYGDRLGGDGKLYLERMLYASKQLKETVDALLDLSRLSRDEMKTVDLDLSSIAREVSLELQRLDPERQVEFVIAAKTPVRGDQNLLRLVMENLLGNAWKFSGYKPAARIEFGVTDGAGREVYFVRDDGAGFAMEYVNKLFIPFQRLHNPAQFAGTGVGLATAQRVIQRHGGSIWAEAKEQQGATFYFTLWG